MQLMWPNPGIIRRRQIKLYFRLSTFNWWLLTFNVKLKAQPLLLIIGAPLKVNDDRFIMLKHDGEMITSGIWKKQSEATAITHRKTARKFILSVWCYSNRVLQVGGKTYRKWEEGGVKREVFVNGSHIFIPAYKPRLAITEDELKSKWWKRIQICWRFWAATLIWVILRSLVFDRFAPIALQIVGLRAVGNLCNLQTFHPDSKCPGKKVGRVYRPILVLQPFGQGCYLFLQRKSQMQTYELIKRCICL